jgi:anti-anti-sigma factor
MLEISRIEFGKELTLELSGRLDSVTAKQLEAYLPLAENKDKVVIDLRELEYVSSAGLRVFLIFEQTLPEKVVIANPNEEVKSVFDMTGFSDILNIEE